MVKFVSYTGKYPSLCTGVLTLEINGKIYKFGNSWLEPENYDKFWYSGGSCGFGSVDYSNEYCEEGPWNIIEQDLPVELRKYYDEIKQVFNENVPHGCCGGCL